MRRRQFSEVDTKLVHAARGDRIKSDLAKQHLELAAAQLAICLASTREAGIPLLQDRINPEGEEGPSDYVAVEELLDEREQDFFPAAKTIVNLIAAGSANEATWRVADQTGHGY